MPIKPEILKQRAVAKSRLFQIEQLELRFSNGVERTYERLAPSGYGAVAVVPLIDTGEVLLIQEYSAGMDEYQWGLPKGAVDPGENPLEAANRELMEEAGFGAGQLHYLKSVCPSPSYMQRGIDIVLAEELYEKSLPGDEPEPLARMTWPLDALGDLLSRGDVRDSVSIAGLFLARDYLATRGELTG
ncbi:MAG TPA: ADP compounds hydrolase NudE [Porticoccaceae bacterium]|nr:ADP compounds hydrolase NudE [Porticoccaceae bacterium]